MLSVDLLAHVNGKSDVYFFLLSCTKVALLLFCWGKSVQIDIHSTKKIKKEEIILDIIRRQSI